MNIDHSVYLMFYFDEYRVNDDVIQIGCTCNSPVEECWFNNSYEVGFHFLDIIKRLRIDKNIYSTKYKKSVKEELLMSSLLLNLLDGVEWEIKDDKLICKNRNNHVVLKAYTEDKKVGFFEKNVWYIKWVEDNSKNIKDIEKVFDFYII